MFIGTKNKGNEQVQKYKNVDHFSFWLFERKQRNSYLKYLLKAMNEHTGVARMSWTTLPSRRGHGVCDMRPKKEWGKGIPFTSQRLVMIFGGGLDNVQPDYKFTLKSNFGKG